MLGMNAMSIYVNKCENWLKKLLTIGILALIWEMHHHLAIYSIVYYLKWARKVAKTWFLWFRIIAIARN